MRTLFQRAGALVGLLAFLLLVGLSSQNASAVVIPVGPNVYEKSTISAYSWDPTVGSHGGFQVGTANDPIAITLEGNAAPWIKQFPDSPAVPRGTEWTLIENIIIGADLPITSWNELYLTNGWSWSDGTVLVNGVTIGGLSTIISEAGNMITFNFNPLAPGTQIQIIKTMHWNGFPGMPVWTGDAPIQIQEWASTVIPEPATIGLLSLGSGLLLFARRRRRHLRPASTV